MLIDAYDQYNNQDTEVIDIQPDDADEQDEAALRADDCESYNKSLDSWLILRQSSLCKSMSSLPLMTSKSRPRHITTGT